MWIYKIKLTTIRQVLIIWQHKQTVALQISQHFNKPPRLYKVIKSSKIVRYKPCRIMMLYKMLILVLYNHLWAVLAQH